MLRFGVADEGWLMRCAERPPAQAAFDLPHHGGACWTRLPEGVAIMWSPLAEQVVSRLIAGLPENLSPETRDLAERLQALPIGWSLWTGCFLRANGEVVLIGEDEDYPLVATIHTERGEVLRALVWGSKRYPELRQLLPERSPGAVDCECQAIPVFAEGKVLCSLCGSLGWLPSSGS